MELMEDLDMRNMMAHLLNVAVTAVLLTDVLFSQPYIYHAVRLDPSDTKSLLCNISRYDFAMKTTQNFITDSIPVFELQTSRDQKWLFLWQGREQNEGQVLVVDTQDPTRRFRLPQKDADKIKWVLGTLYSAGLDRFYVTTTFEKYGENSVYRASDLALIDSFSQELVTFSANGNISSDGECYIAGRYDPVANKSYIIVFSLSSKKIIYSTPLSAIGPPIEDKYGMDGRNGMVLLGYVFPESSADGGKYLTFDALHGKQLAEISYPEISEACLSSTGSYVIIQNTPPNANNDPTGSSHLRTGVVYVFDSRTGVLKQRSVFIPGGRVYVFNGYPDKCFYYVADPDAPKSAEIDLHKITPTGELLDTLVSLKHQAVTNHWLGDEQFVRELDNELANAQKHLARSDSVNCRKELEIFQQKLKHEFERKAGKGEKRFVTEEGYALLYFNALYLIERLPERR